MKVCFDHNRHSAHSKSSRELGRGSVRKGDGSSSIREEIDVGRIGGRRTDPENVLFKVIVAAGAGRSRLQEVQSAMHAPGIPLTVEYAGTATYRQALEYLRAAMREAGLREA